MHRPSDGQALADRRPESAASIVDVWLVVMLLSGEAGAMPTWWSQLQSRFRNGAPPRGSTGDPRSSNGASSFHLRWDLYGEFTEVSVVLEVVEPPEVDRLYFWALQGDFSDSAGRAAGGAHLGLQWHPQHPGSVAVNWGGYDQRGRVLGGSESSLPSALGNPHTRDFVWFERTPYRLTIAKSMEFGAERPAWRGSVTNLATGVETTIRDLYPAGDRITGVVMWSEVFARCDHPSVAVRWSDAYAITTDGTRVVPAAVVTNYQSVTDGGCTNTDSSTDSGGVIQRTNTPRLHRGGLRLPLE